MQSLAARRLFLLGGSLAFSLACWFDRPAFLRGTSRHHGGWLWTYYTRPRRPISVAVALALFTLFALLLHTAAKRNRGWWWPTVSLCAGAFALQLALVGLTKHEQGYPWIPLAAHELSEKGTGYFQAIDQWPDLGPLFREWPTLRAGLPRPHVPYHPPFALLPAWLSRRAVEASPGLGQWLTRITRTQRLAPSSGDAAAALVAALMALGACAATPLLGVSLLRARAEPDPIVVAALATTLPALLIHTPTLYQMQVPLFMASCLLAQRVRLPLGALLAGLVVGILAELNFVALALGNLVAVMVWVRARGGGRMAMSVSAVGGGALLVLLAAQAATGFSWTAGVLAVLKGRLAEGELSRPYWASLWRNLIDVLVWCGPLPLAGAVLGAGRAMSALLRRLPADGLPLAVITALGVLDASGAIRVEAGRIWMPYFPITLMAAVPTIRRLLPGRWLWLGGGLQLAHTGVLLSRWG